MVNLRHILAALVCVVALVTSPAAARDKVALVIGNSDYAHASRLVNPDNDSRAMADKLEALGFSVFLHQNAGGQKMRVALGQFTEAALGAEIALVFYAGHGIEMSGRNYLIPVDAEMRSEATAQFEALSLDNVIAAVTQASKLGMIMLDACRDNPFAAQMQRNNGTRSLSRGLAPVSIEGQQGLLVSFAAEEGSTADDGAGMHSPYTAALLDVIDDPGLEVGRMFRKVRAQVREATGGRQVPIERMQLPDEAIYFVPKSAEPVVKTPTQKEPEPERALVQDPMVVYLDAVQSGEIGPLNDFITRYPDHARAKDARNLVLAMQDDAFWEKTMSANTIQAYRRYLLAFSDGQYTQNAAEQIAALSPKEPDPEPPVAKTPAVQSPVVQVPEPKEPEVQDGAQTRPSFDCAKAATVVERAICSDADLAEQDNGLAQVFANARARGAVTAEAQKQWIKEREAICGPRGRDLSSCVRELNADRINALHSGRITGNLAPSFNCAKAGTPVEHALCQSDALARQDQHLLKVYKSARSRGRTSTNKQKAWLKQREANCAGRGAGVPVCIAEMTAQRIIALGG